MTAKGKTSCRKTLYVCTNCGKSFHHSSHLAQHPTVHSGDWPYRCEDCGCGFSQSSKLLEHQRVLIEERPYTCKDCGHCFGHNSTLTQHWRIHSGKRPYKFPPCGKIFCQSSALMRHHRINTGELPYNCQGCGQHFRYLLQFTRPQKMHIEERDSTATVVEGAAILVWKNKTAHSARDETARETVEETSVVDHGE